MDKKTKKFNNNKKQDQLLNEEKLIIANKKLKDRKSIPLNQGLSELEKMDYLWLWVGIIIQAFILLIISIPLILLIFPHKVHSI